MAKGAGKSFGSGFNEMWRLRRQYGEKYYRQFWSQLIYRLGMSHALGFDKRFVVRLDQQQYRAEDKVTLSVEAYDENYEPLSGRETQGSRIDRGAGGSFGRGRASSKNCRADVAKGIVRGAVWRVFGWQATACV